MKKYQEIVNNLTNSTHSSILDYGLATSGFQNISNLSEVEEDCIEENKFSTYNVGLDQNKKFVNNDPVSRGNAHYFIKGRNTHQSPDKRKTGQKRGKSAMERSDEKMRDQKENVSPPKKQSRMTSAQEPKCINEQYILDHNQRRIAIADVTNRQSMVSSLNTTAEYEKLVQAGSFISSYPSSNYSFVSSSKGDMCHRLTLKIKFDTYYGQQLAVVGNIPQLGSWDVQNAYRMTWSEGHIWVADNIVLSEANGDKSYFMYKYILLHEGHFQKYERGLDRIADVKLLKEQEAEGGYGIQQNKDENYYICQNNTRKHTVNQKGRESHGPFSYEVQDAPRMKNVMIFDEWEQYQVNFQVFNPVRKDGDTLRINGDREELGNWCQGSGPQKMKLSTRRQDWMNNEKYGKKVKPYEFNGQKFQNHEQQCPIQIRYNYSRRSSSLQKFSQKEITPDWEREPCRLIEIQDPNTYQGQKGRNKKNQWLNTSKVWVVNGQLNKCDANFKQNFNISEMGKTGVIIGNSPIIEEDVVKLYEKKVTAVLNLQSDVQDLQHMKELYAKYNIYCVENYPIQEFNRTKDLCEKLLWAAKIVNHMLTVLRHETIYVHCAAGITRAPSVLLTYLCLFCKIDSWQNPLEVFRFLRRERKVCYPNMKAVVKTISCNRQFQFQQNLLQQAENEQKASIEAAKRHYFLQRAEEQKARLGNFKKIIDERRQVRKEERKARIQKRLEERVRMIEGSMRESVASQIGHKQGSPLSQIKLSDGLLFQNREMLQYGTPNRTGEGSPIAMVVDDAYDEQCRISPEHYQEIKEQIEREEQETDEEVCKHEAQVIAQQKRLTRFLEQHEELEQEHLKSSLFRHQFESSENVIRDSGSPPKRITIISQDEPFPTAQKQIFELAKNSDSNGVQNYYESPRMGAPVDVSVHTADELSSFNNINDNIEKLLKATHEEIERLDQEEEERNVREQLEREDHKQQLEEIIQQAQESARKDLDRLKEIRLEQQSWSSQDGDIPVEIIEQVEVKSDLPHDRKKNLQAKKQSKISDNNRASNSKSPNSLKKSKDVSPRSPGGTYVPRGMSSSCKQHSDSNRSDLQDHELQDFMLIDHNNNNKGPSNHVGKRASSGINMTRLSQPKPAFGQSTTQFDPTTVAHTSDTQVEHEETKEDMPFEMCNKKSIVEEERRERENLENSMESNHLDEDTSQLMAMVERRKTEIEERMSRIDGEIKVQQEQVKTSSDEDLKVSSDEEKKSNQVSTNQSQKTDGITIPKLEMANIGSFFDNVLSSCRHTHENIDPRSRLGKDLRSIGLSQEELDRKVVEFFDGADYRKNKLGLKFAPQTDSTLELAIQITLTEQDTKVPVMHLQESNYLIGTDSCHCELRRTKVMVRVGGKTEGLETYLGKNHQRHMRQLMVSMIKNNETLEQTVQRIVSARIERMSEVSAATVPATFSARIRSKREKSPSQISEKSALTRKSHLMTQSSSKPIVAPKNRIHIDLRGSGMMTSQKPIMTSQKTPGRGGQLSARLNRSESKWEPQSATGRQIIARGSNATQDSGIEVRKPLQKSYTNKLLAKAAGDSGLKSTKLIQKEAQDKKDFDALTMNSQGKSQTAIRGSKHAKKNKNKFVLQ